MDTSPARRRGRIYVGRRAIALIALAWLPICQSAGADLVSPQVEGPFVVTGVQPQVFSGDVRSLPKVLPDALEGVDVNPRQGIPHFPVQTPVELDTVLQDLQGSVALTAQSRAAGSGELSPSILNFDGISTGANPHDPVGDVGPDHYVQMINAAFAIWDKSGTLLAGPSNINTLWTSQGISGTPCSDNNNGDPIVLYDRLADRWLLSQFARPNHLCIAISQTPDPTTQYFLYEFNVNQFPDYFKLGVWPDGYYMSSNLGGGQTHAAVFERAAMLAGTPAQQVVMMVSGLPNLGFDIFLPSDLDGPTSPPTGSPNYFYRQHDGDNLDGSGNDRVEIWEFSVNWTNPGAATFTGPMDIALSSFDSALCGFNSFACVPQPPTAARPNPPLLDPINEPPMWRHQYRNFGSHETLLGSFVVDADGNDGHGIRWFELRRSGAGPMDVASRRNLCAADGGCTL